MSINPQNYSVLFGSYPATAITKLINANNYSDLSLERDFRLERGGKLFVVFICQWFLWRHEVISGLNLSKIIK